MPHLCFLLVENKTAPRARTSPTHSTVLEEGALFLSYCKACHNYRFSMFCSSVKVLDGHTFYSVGHSLSLQVTFFFFFFLMSLLPTRDLPNRLGGWPESNRDLPVFTSSALLFQPQNTTHGFLYVGVGIKLNSLHLLY